MQIKRGLRFYSLVVIFIAAILAMLLIYLININPTKVTDNKKPGQENSVSLNNLNHFPVPGEKTPGNATPSTNVSLGGAGAYGGSSQHIITSALGKLEIINKIDAPYTSHACNIVHMDGATEGIDDDDHVYGAMFNPSNIAAKVISKVGSTELDVDLRPLNSGATINLELSLVSSSGDPVSIESENELILSYPLEGYTFDSSTLILQQYDPDDANAVYPAYNVTDVIDNQQGIITLENITGSHDSEVPYAYFTLTFS